MSRASPQLSAPARAAGRCGRDATLFAARQMVRAMIATEDLPLCLVLHVKTPNVIMMRSVLLSAVRAEYGDEVADFLKNAAGERHHSSADITGEAWLDVNAPVFDQLVAAFYRDGALQSGGLRPLAERCVYMEREGARPRGAKTSVSEDERRRMIALAAAELV